MLELLKTINESIDALLDAIAAWSDRDFPHARAKVYQSLGSLKQVKSTLAENGEKELLETYLQDIIEVEDLIQSVDPFLSRKIQNIEPSNST